MHLMCHLMKAYVIMYDKHQSLVKLFHKSKVLCSYISLQIIFVLFEVLRPGQQFFSLFGMASWVEPVLSNWDKGSCSRTQRCTPGEDRTRNLAIKCLPLSQLSYRCSQSPTHCNTCERYQRKFPLFSSLRY